MPPKGPRAKRGKTSQESSSPNGMRVPSHGKGMLRNGGTNKGGPGRPPDEVRQACRRAFDERIPLLQSIADDTENDPMVRMKAIETLGKYGLGTTFTPTDTDGKTLGAGVLAVPVPVTSEQWAGAAKAQQSALLSTPSKASPIVS